MTYIYLTQVRLLLMRSTLLDISKALLLFPRSTFCRCAQRDSGTFVEVFLQPEQLCVCVCVCVCVLHHVGQFILPHLL